MKSFVALLFLAITLPACTDRPGSDVCGHTEDLPSFICETTKHNFEGAKAKKHIAFYVSADLKERAIPNLSETLLNSSQGLTRIDIGGTDAAETKKVIIAALENLKLANANLNNMQVMYFGPAFVQSLSSSFEQLGAEFVFIEYGQL